MPPHTKSPRTNEDRRKELADFLKTRRARVRPSDDGRFILARRRTPGLRREEVAEMAGISSSWYTWLEQGRDIRPSSELLERLGHILRLNSFETHHLFTLAGREPPEQPAESLREEVPESLRKLVLGCLRVPASVMGERFDFLLWNEEFARQVYDLEAVSPSSRNWLEAVFVHEPSLGPLPPDWRERARRTVAEFRWSVGNQIGNPRVKDLVARLSRQSAEFARLWRLHDVEERKTSRMLEVRHEKLGTLSFLRSIYIPLEAEHLRLVVLTPIPKKTTRYPGTN